MSETVVDASYAYFVLTDPPVAGKATSAQISRVSKKGGPIQNLTKVAGEVSALVVEGAELFFVLAPNDTDDDTLPSELVLHRLPIAGGKAQPIKIDGIDQLGKYVVDKKSIYFATKKGVSRAPRSGGLAEHYWDVGTGSVVAANGKIAYLEKSNDDMSVKFMPLVDR